MDCVTAWSVTSPQVFELNGGEDTDPNAISFAKGYNKVIWGTEPRRPPPLTAGTTNSAATTLVGDQIAPGWDNTNGGTIFQQQFTAHPKINATVEANDGLANAVITVLKGAGVKAKKIPTTGQDATLQGMENILQASSADRSTSRSTSRPRPPSPWPRPAGRPDAAGGPGERHDRPTRQTSATAAGVLLTPIWVTKPTWKRHGDHGQVRQGHGPVRSGRRERLHRGRHQVPRRGHHDGA